MLELLLASYVAYLAVAGARFARIAWKERLTFRALSREARHQVARIGPASWPDDLSREDLSHAERLRRRVVVDYYVLFALPLVLGMVATFFFVLLEFLRHKNSI